MDKRDQVVANIAVNLGLIDPPRFQQALQLKAKHPKVPFEQVLIQARMIDAAGYQRLAAAFNDVLNQARAQAGHPKAQQAAPPPAPEPEGVFDEPTMVVPDEPEEIQVLDVASDVDVFDEPTMVVRDEPDELTIPDDDDVYDQHTMVVPDEDDDSVFDQHTMVVPDEDDDSVFDQHTMVVPDDDDDVFDQNTMVVPDEDDDSVYDQHTMVIPSDEGEALADAGIDLVIPELDEDEILAQPTMIVSDEPAAAPPPKRKRPLANSDSLKLASTTRSGVKRPGSRGPGPLDREEFQRRLKLRLGFEGCTLGDYKVHGEIARGAFGVVLEVEAEGMTGNLAKQRGYAGRMALKVALENKTDPRETERFLHETRVQIRFDHPHIVRIFDCGVEQGLTYYSMELIQGIEARTHVLRHGPMPPLLAARLTIETAQALAYVHSQKIYHRDLKPHNIMIDQAQKPYRAVLIDFGLVVESESGKDKGLIVGTPSYMPPEQAQPRGGHGPINGTTDIYSLGATLYFLLTGRAPFTGRDPRKIIKQLVANPPPDPVALNPKLPRGLADVVLKCLEKKQADRYHSANLLIADLEKEVRSGKLKLKAKTFLGRFGLGKKK